MSAAGTSQAALTQPRQPLQLMRVPLQRDGAPEMAPVPVVAAPVVVPAAAHVAAPIAPAAAVQAGSSAALLGAPMPGCNCGCPYDHGGHHEACAHPHVPHHVIH